MLTTASMVRLGKTYGNVMVDLQLTNEKLVERARRIVMTIAEVDYASAASAIENAGGNVKTALVMSIVGCSRETAEQRLANANGHIRTAIKGTP
jgi:N-acetylmuramic acid 6-phosphate etherase